MNQQTPAEALAAYCRERGILRVRARDYRGRQATPVADPSEILASLRVVEAQAARAAFPVALYGLLT